MPIDWDAAVLGPLEGQFGEAAIYIPKSGASPYPVTGVFDAGHRELTLLDPMSPASTVSPVFGVRAAALAAAPIAGDRIRIASNGVTYVVRDPQPDGHGWIKLLLNRSGNQA